jgi:hypothetical protein
MKLIADYLVWLAVFHGVVDPVVAIFSGTLWGSHAFLGGAFVVTSILFGNLYFEDDLNAVL